MERDTALAQLNEIRNEILGVYSESEKCKEIQQKSEKLLNEKSNAEMPKVSLLPDDTAEKLKEKFIRENREKLLNSKSKGRIVTIISAAIMLVFIALLFCDIFLNANILLNSSVFSLVADMTDKIVLFIMQVALSAFFIVFPIKHKPVKKFVTVLLIISAVVFAVFYIGLITGFSAWVYFIVPAICFIASLVASKIIDLSKKKRAQNPNISQSQNVLIEKAKKDDEKAKKKNTETAAHAQAEWEERKKSRKEKIDSELKALAKEYKVHRKELDIHFDALKQMDYLCEDDKNLQIVDLLIRFIETRRADSIKEALHEYDKLLVNKQMLEIEKQKVEAELKKASLEHSDRMKRIEAEERHNFEMRCIAADNARARENIARQLDSIGNTIYYDLHY